MDEMQNNPLWRVMAPPQVITFFCESYIPPDRPEDQRLRELANRQGVAA